MEKDVISEKAVKAVIFDVGGVLQLGAKTRVSPRQVHISGVHEYIANKLKITIDQYLDSIDSAYARSIEGHISKSVLMGILSSNLNCPKEKLEKLYHKAYKKRFKRNNWLYDVVKQLKKKGYKVAILSDQWHLSADVLIPEKDQQLFDKVALSCEEGLRKPDKNFYELILNRLKISPEEAIFIDNQAWNIVPAHKLGMKTVLFTDNKKVKEQLAHWGIYVR